MVNESCLGIWNILLKDLGRQSEKLQTKLTDKQINKIALNKNLYPVSSFIQLHALSKNYLCTFIWSHFSRSHFRPVHRKMKLGVKVKESPGRDLITFKGRNNVNREHFRGGWAACGKTILSIRGSKVSIISEKISFRNVWLFFKFLLGIIRRTETFFNMS